MGKLKIALYALGAALIIFLLGYGTARYTTPIKTVTVEKQVVVEHKDVVTKTVETKKPDGTITTTTIVQDKSTTDTKSDTKDATVFAKPSYKVDGLIGYSWKDARQVYGAQIQKRFAGPVYLGAWGLNNGSVGVSVGIEF